MPETIGYTNRLTRDGRIITKLSLPDGTVPVFGVPRGPAGDAHGITPDPIGAAKLDRDGDAVTAGMVLWGPRPEPVWDETSERWITPVPLLSLRHIEANVQLSPRGEIEAIAVTGQADAVIFDIRPAWSELAVD